MKCNKSGLSANTIWLPIRPSSCSAIPTSIGRSYHLLAHTTLHSFPLTTCCWRRFLTRGRANTHKTSKASSRSSRLADGISKQFETNPNAFKHGLRKLLRKTQNSYHPGWGRSFEGEKPPGFRKMRSYIQFLTTPTVDTPGTALLLHFDEKRYIVGNIHEGIQRAMTESGTKLMKVTDVFITGKTEWKSVGGLFGIILTLADAVVEARASLRETLRRKMLRRGQNSGETQSGALAANDSPDIPTPTINVHGGPNLMHFFATARRFIFRKGMPVNVLEYEEAPEEQGVQERQPDWVDSCVQVWTLAINPSGGSATEGHTPYVTETAYPALDSLFQPQQSIKAKQQADQQIRKKVVSEMFDSAWRLDQLEERQLSQVLEEGIQPPMYIRQPVTNKLERYYPPVSGIVPNITVLMRKAWPGALVPALPPSRPLPTALSYIIRNHRQRGKFLPENAKHLNVEMGYQWAELASGKSVQSKDGKTVTPEMVLAEGKEGGGIAVVDLPSIDYVEGLIARPEWQAANAMTGVGAILWLLGPDVSKDQRLQDFIRHRPDLEHIVSSPDDCPNYLAFGSSAASALRHNQVGAQYFPIPIHNNIPTLQANPRDTPLKRARRGQLLQLAPQFENDGSAIVPFLHTAQVLEATPESVLKMGRAARQEIERRDNDQMENSWRLPSEDAEIAFLGTGSSSPSKYRNVAGILLRVPGCGSYLLDCGENTLGQMKRIYGPETFREILQDLRLIWISHLHADHHLGTASVIKAWYEEIYGGNTATQKAASILDEIANPARILETERRLVIVGPTDMMQWLKEYASVEDYGYTRIIPLAARYANGQHLFLQWHQKYINRINISDKPGYSSGPLGRALREATGLTDLNACLVSHCYDAHAVSLTFPTGFKISYSGDCRPSKAFAEIGRNSTVLLHEATFDDELQTDAEAKRHSTMSEAIGVGLAMRAKRVILTHFSQRYQKLPMMDSVGDKPVKLEEEEPQEPGVPLDEGVTDAAIKTTTEGSLDVFESDSNGIQAEPFIERSWSPKHKKEHKSQALQSPIARASSPNNMGSSAEARRSRSHSPSRSHRSASVVSIPASAAKEMKVCVAFDYMKLKVKDIEHMEKFTPALRELYSQEAMEAQAATAAATAEREQNKQAKRKKQQTNSSNKNNDKKPRRQDGDGRAEIQPRIRSRSPHGHRVERKESDQAQSTPQPSAVPE